MDIVVCDVAGDHQSDLGYVQARRVIGVGIADVHDDEFVALELEAVAVERFGYRDLVGDLAGEPRLVVRVSGCPLKACCFIRSTTASAAICPRGGAALEGLVRG